MLDPPRLLVFQAFLEVGVVRLVLGGNPEEDVAVVAGGGQGLACLPSAVVSDPSFRSHTSRTPSNDIDSLRVLDERRKIADFPLLAVGFDPPKLCSVSNALLPREQFCRAHTLTLLSPPAVARRPLPCGSKCAE